MKARALRVATFVVVAALFPPVGPARADTPEGGGTPGSSVTVTPDDNLTSPATVTVSATGFRPTWTAYITQCGVQPAQNVEDCVDLVAVTTNASGNLSAQVTVASSFSPLGAPVINCLSTNCFVRVATEEKNASHHISFSGGIGPRHDPVADFDGDRDTDVSIYRPSTGQWFINGAELITWGASGDIPVPADYTGDGRTDAAVYRPGTGQWFIQGAPLVTWGASGDIPVPADYTGDNRADPAVYRPSTGQWFINGGNPPLVTWGSTGDVPVPADYTGDGRADVAIYRPSTGQWFINGGNPPLITWGGSGDVPVPGDYTGDGKADAAIYRPSTGQWFINGGNPPLITWGSSGDIPVPGDYTNDGRTDAAIYRPSTGQWFIHNLVMVPWGSSGDIPLPLPYAIRRVYFP